MASFIVLQRESLFSASKKMPPKRIAPRAGNVNDRSGASNINGSGLINGPSTGSEANPKTAPTRALNAAERQGKGETRRREDKERGLGTEYRVRSTEQKGGMVRYAEDYGEVGDGGEEVVSGGASGGDV